MRKNLPPEIEEYVKRRHKTRFVRSYGGVIVTFVFLGIALAFITQLVLRELNSESMAAGATEEKSVAAPEPVAKPAKRQETAAPAAKAETAVVKPTPTQEKSDGAASQQAMSQWDEAARVIEGFFSTSEAKERLSWVAPARDLETKLRDYEKRAKGLPWLGKPDKIGPQFALQGSYLITTITFKGHKPRHIALERTTLGWRVDWESYVGWCERPLREIAAANESGEAFEVRAEAYRVNPPPPGYPADEYLALLLRHPDDGTALQAVVPRKMLGDTPAGKTMSESLPGRYTLRVKPSSGAAGEDGWAEVSEIICPGWLPRLYASSHP